MNTPAHNAKVMNRLALTKRLVELQAGRIRVTSQPGEGATFVVELPLLRPTQELDVTAR